MLHGTAIQLSTRPDTLPLYTLRLLPLTLERGAVLAEAAHEERHATDAAQTAYEDERRRVEDEWRRGRERVRERLMEGIEERRRRAREEKEGEGTAGGTFPRIYTFNIAQSHPWPQTRAIVHILHRQQSQWLCAYDTLYYLTH